MMEAAVSDILLSPQLISPSFLQLHKQQTQAEPERHVWHRRESDESGESAPEEGGEGARAPQPIPRSASYPCATPRPGAPETTALHGGFQRRYGGITGIQLGVWKESGCGKGGFLGEERGQKDGAQEACPIEQSLNPSPLSCLCSCCLSRSWHSAPGSLSLFPAAPWRVG